VISLAGARYSNHNLVEIDNQTIQMPTGGISWIPLPPGAAFGLTGLLSIQLADTVRRGDVYKIVVRQVTDTFARRPPIILKTGEIAARAVAQPPSTDLIRWRRIVGSYQITIPVRTKEVILVRETRLLSVLRWILQSVPTGNRWYPVFSRYVDLIGDRVDGLGGDQGGVRPSPDGSGGEQPGGGPGTGPGPEPERTRSHEGKITGLIYDCFGDFRGFLLSDCGKETEFESREHRIEALARIAWRKRIAVVVVSSVAHPRRPLSITLRRAPEPFQL
jgi:hypothetical protein